VAPAAGPVSLAAGGVDWSSLGGAVALVAAALTELYLVRDRPEQRWYEGRAAAESPRRWAGGTRSGPSRSASRRCRGGTRTGCWSGGSTSCYRPGRPGDRAGGLLRVAGISVDLSVPGGTGPG
jgi:hypothetical protein